MRAGNMRRIVGIGTLVAAAGACSGGDDGVATRDGGSTDDSAEEDAVDYSADSDGPDSRVPGSSELEATLLTLDDMPDGWVDLQLHYSAVEICLRTEMPETLGEDQYPTGAAAFAAEEGAFLPDVFEKVVAAPEGQGQAVFDTARGYLAMCGNSGGEVDGLAFLDAYELTVPTLGDETIGRRITIEHQATQTVVGIDVLYARAGDTIVAVGVVEPEGRTDRLVELATIAFERATAA